MSVPETLIFTVIDDDPDIIAVASAILEAAGHRVSSETSSAEALAKLERVPPDCVLLDIMMPGMDGLEFCKQLRKQKKFDKTKIIIVSSKSFDFDQRRAKEYSADGYIVKPIIPGTYLRKIEKIIEDKIEMQFWGVRGTLPVPGEDTIIFGGNTNCVALEFAKEPMIILDAGTGIKRLSDHLITENRNHINAKLLISHPHWDHINGIPYFSPLYAPGNKFEIIGPSHGDVPVENFVSDQMGGIYFPVTPQEFGANISYQNLEEGEFAIDDIQIKTMALYHPGYCLGYRLEYNNRSICYITDQELHLQESELHDPYYLEKLINFCRDADVIITDCTYTDEEYKTKVGWGHSCTSQVANFADQAQVKSLFLYHHDPDQNDDAIEQKFESYLAAFDELNSETVCISPSEGSSFRV